jgi:hypothetical protein
MSSNQVTIDECGIATTFNDTPTLIYSIDQPVNEDCVGWTRTVVSARRVSDGASKCFVFETGYTRDGDGDVVLFGTTEVDRLASSGSALDDLEAEYVVDGGHLQIQVVGQAATSIDWTVLNRGFHTYHL